METSAGRLKAFCELLFTSSEISSLVQHHVLIADNVELALLPVARRSLKGRLQIARLVASWVDDDHNSGTCLLLLYEIHIRYSNHV